MKLNFTESEAFALAFLLVVFVVVPAAWVRKISLYKFIYLAGGIFLLAIALLSLSDPSFCKDCGIATWPIFVLLFWAFGHWGTRAFVILWALWFLWIALKEPGHKKRT